MNSFKLFLHSDSLKEVTKFDCKTITPLVIIYERIEL